MVAIILTDALLATCEFAVNASESSIVRKIGPRMTLYFKYSDVRNAFISFLPPMTVQAFPSPWRPANDLSTRSTSLKRNNV